MRFVSVAIVLLSFYFCTAQDTYIVFLNDKKHSSYSIAAPSQFLSQRAIARRTREQVGVSEDDLPVSDFYVEQVLALPVSHRYNLKWENAIVVTSAVAGIETQLKGFPFVKEVVKISKSTSSSMSKFDLENRQLRECIAAEIPEGYYGAAENQNRQLHIESLHRRGFWGNDVLISMMDVGFTAANNNHYFDSIFQSNRVLYTYDFVYGESNVYNNSSHGLSAWSCIAANTPYSMVGTAPNGKFLLFVTEDDNSETIAEEYNWAKAAEVADSMGADVFSTSLGYTTFDATDSIDSHTYADLDGHSTPITRAANHAAGKGILVCNSAGNEGSKPWHFISAPADGDSVIAVGAVNSAGQYASFSSHGPNSSGVLKPNLCAQGAGTAVVNVGSIVGTSNGTSFSCPVLAGAMACMRQAFPESTNFQIQDAVQRSANYFSNPNDDYGYGIPNFELAYFMLKKPEWFAAKLSRDFIKIGPNPFCTSLEVYFGAQSEQGFHLIHIYDLSGKQIAQKLAPHNNSTFEIVELGGFDDIPQGNYLISLDNGKATFFQKQ